MTAQTDSLAPWECNNGFGLFTVEQTAARVGHYTWVEMQLFEILGSWAGCTPELEIKLKLGTVAFDHGFHAELWQKRIPEFHGTEPESLIVAPNDHLVDFFAAMNQTEPEQTLERLVGMYRVLAPHLVAAYSFHLNRISEVSDGYTAKLLKLCLRTETENWRNGELMVQSLIGETSYLERMCNHQGRLLELIVKSGGAVGEGSIGHSTIIA